MQYREEVRYSRNGGIQFGPRKVFENQKVRIIVSFKLGPPPQYDAVVNFLFGKSETERKRVRVLIQ